MGNKKENFYALYDKYKSLIIKDLSEIELMKIYKKFEGFEKFNDSDLILKIASIFYLSL